MRSALLGRFWGYRGTETVGTTAVPSGENARFRWQGVPKSENIDAGQVCEPENDLCEQHSIFGISARAV
jgi:hypothetical protein